MEKSGMSPLVRAVLWGVCVFAFCVGADYIRDALVFKRAFSPDWILNAIVAVGTAVITFVNANKQK